MQVNLLQCQSGTDVEANLAFITAQLAKLPKDKQPQLVVLPECCLLFAASSAQTFQQADSATHNRLKQALSQLARQYQVYLVAGTIPVLSDDDRLYNRCYLFDDRGDVLGQYDKLHLFDAAVADGVKQYRESDNFKAGDHISVIDTPFGKLGLAVCYDVRFPELFRAMRLAGAEIIALPAAFTVVTGKAHWQALLQARAIDNQCYILASAQWGVHNHGVRETWGHSMVIDPWGAVLTCKDSDCGWLQAKIEHGYIKQVRQQMPLMDHNRFIEPKLK